MIIKKLAEEARVYSYIDLAPIYTMASPP